MVHVVGLHRFERLLLRLWLSIGYGCIFLARLFRRSIRHWVWVDGQYIPYFLTRVLLGAHALHYGSAVFEGIRVYRGRNGRLAVWMLREHVERLYRSMGELGLTVHVKGHELMDAILQIVALNDDGSSPTLYIRPVVFFNVDPETLFGLGVDPGTSNVSVAIMTQPWGKYVNQHLLNDGALVYVTKRVRPERRTVNGLVKLSGTYGILSVPGKLQARAHGCSEAIFVNVDGAWLDGSGQNVFALIQRGPRLVIQTPHPERANILWGITLQYVVEQLLPLLQQRHPDLDFEYVDGLVPDHTWVGAGFTGTAVEVMPITAYRSMWFNGTVKQHVIGDGNPHPIVLELAKLYLTAVRGELEASLGHLSEAPDRTEVLRAMP